MHNDDVNAAYVRKACYYFKPGELSLSILLVAMRILFCSCLCTVCSKRLQTLSWFVHSILLFTCHAHSVLFLPMQSSLTSFWRSFMGLVELVFPSWFNTIWFYCSHKFHSFRKLKYTLLFVWIERHDHSVHMSSVLQVQLYTAGIPLLEAYLLPTANSQRTAATHVVKGSKVHRYRLIWSTIACTILTQHAGKITYKHDMHIVEVFSTEYTVQRMVAVGNTHQTGYPSDRDVEGSTRYSQDCSIPHSVPEHWHKGQPAGTALQGVRNLTIHTLCCLWTVCQ